MSLVDKKKRLAARSGSPRSRIVSTRKEREKPITSRTVRPMAVEQLNTFQKTEQRAVDTKQNIIVQRKEEATPSVNQSIIVATEIDAVNKIRNILTLEAGESLKDIIINHYHGSATSTVLSLHWSFESIAEIQSRAEASMTVSSGVITQDYGAMNRLITDTFLSGTTLSIANNGLDNIFQNVNQTVHFFAVCSVLGPTITAIKQ